MLRPTIVTHRRPHLDEVCALWIIQKYWPNFGDADIVFINTGPDGGDVWNEIPADTHPLVIYVGVGRGRFDEHKGDQGASAASLVWAETKRLFNPRKGESLAIDRLVDYARREDLAEFMLEEHREYSLPSILNGLFGTQNRDSQTVYEIGRKILDAILFELYKQISVERDWQGRVDFDTPWGLGAACVSDVPGIDRQAFRNGYVIVITHNTTNTYAGFRAKPGSAVDLTEAFMQIKQLEPDKPWFLHQSKKMLLCGGDIADQGSYSELTLDRLMEIVRAHPAL